MTKLERFIYARDFCGWHADKEGNVFNKKGRRLGSMHHKGYLITTLQIQNKQYNITLHQFIYWFFKSHIVKCVDHINRNKLDNRIDNLRSVTNQENLFNTEAKGYCYHKVLNKYQARITVDSKTLFLGYFDTPEEATEAYLQAKKLYHKI